MEPRYPPFRLRLSNPYSTRRRSGAFSPNPAQSDPKVQDRPHATSTASPYLTIQVEDVDTHDESLVQKSPTMRTPGTPVQRRLRRFPSFGRHLQPLKVPEEEQGLRDLEKEGLDEEGGLSSSSGGLCKRLDDGSSAVYEKAPKTFLAAQIPALSRYAPWNESRRTEFSSPGLSRCSSTYSASSEEFPTNTFTRLPTRQFRKPTLVSAPARVSDRLTVKFPVVRIVASRREEPVKGLAVVSALLHELRGPRVQGPRRWTVHKWVLVFSVLTMLVYGGVALSWAGLTWANGWQGAYVMHVTDYDLVLQVTLTSSFVLLLSIVGLTGSILNSRRTLAIYTILLWPAFFAIVAIGYTSYKRYAYALDRKLNWAWSQWYTSLGRLVIQDTLGCCGYYSSLHDASPSAHCYTRTRLPGCKGRLLRFEREHLRSIWCAAFIIASVHIVNIFVAMLCANHVDRRFGKGMVPRQYRLTREDLVRDREEIVGRIREMGGVVRPQVSRALGSGVSRAEMEKDSIVLEDVLPMSLRPGVQHFRSDVRRR